MKRIAIRTVAGAVAACLSLQVAAADIYGYVDADGVAHYTDMPDSPQYRLVLRDPERYLLKQDSRYRLRSQNEAPEPVALAAPQFDPRQPYGDIISREAQSNGLDPFLVLAVIAVESNHNPTARSPKGAIGLMQLMPDTARRFGVEDPYRAESNIRGGTRYLRYLLALFDGDLALALAAYNAGENAVIRYGHRVPPYAETQDYVPKVLRKYDALRSAPPT